MHERSLRRRLRLPLSLLPLLTPLPLIGCASNPWPAEIVAAPREPVNPYRYLTWSKHDTRATIDQIRRHNALHRRMTAAK